MNVCHSDVEDDKLINHEIWPYTVFRQTKHMYVFGKLSLDVFGKLSLDVLYVSHVGPFVLFGG